MAPLKAQSICRLELMGALIGARLAETVVNELTIRVDAAVFWSLCFGCCNDGVTLD